MKIVSSNQIREIERKATEEIGIPQILLMENAALAGVHECIETLKGIENPKVAVIAGKGKNGGDGLAIARHLHLRGYDVGIIFVGDKEEAAEECRLNLKIVENLNIPINEIPNGDSLLDIPYTIETCDLVVDAMIGMGLKGSVTDYYEYVIETINEYAKYVISIDCPTGVEADTGLVNGLAVHANKTVTFTLPKMGLILYPGCEYAGEIVLKDIGTPVDPIEESTIRHNILSDEEVKSLLPKRPARSNKGTYGKAILFAGSKVMPGSAVLTACALYKAGAGLVNACVIQNVAANINNTVPEAVTFVVPEKDGKYCADSFYAIERELDDATCIVIGPGIGKGDGVTEFVRLVLRNAKVPLIIDADAINCIAENMDMLDDIKVPCVITPHPGEMSKLTGLTAEEILNNIIKVSEEFSEKHNVVVLLKDTRSVIADTNKQIYINKSGSAAMAKAGSGDVLTGIIGAFVAQGKDVFAGAVLGAYISGLAGEVAAESLSKYGVLAQDIVNCVPYILNKFQ